MQEELISFETAKLAKEKGFDEVCSYLYENSKEIVYTTHKNSGLNKHFDWYSAPTQSLLQKWLREVHNILVYVDPRSHHIFQYHIITEDDEIIGSDRLNNWELTLEKGLQEALKLI